MGRKESNQTKKKLKKSCSGFDLVTVLISKQSFFQHRVWHVKQGNSYLHGIALQDFVHREQRLRWIGGGLGFFSVDTILHTFPSAPACIACTDMVYLKALACDVTTTAILRLKTLAFIPS